ncbi:MAG TPA: dihydroorotate dehydrogenase-like protein [Thermoanaerobaculia bacterium]|nr:dihydroorotate dehydrogenase-like protein [Thermoanaerobaculia bacterium]
MDLTTVYLGMALPHPLMPGASPLVDDLDTVRRLEDAGAAAIVMHSLFQEQIVQDEVRRHVHLAAFDQSSAEALSYFPPASEFELGPEEYLEHVARLKAAVRVPVVASLNGTSRESWVEYARLIEQAGADALEVNCYFLATDPMENGDDVERRTIEVAEAVRNAVKIPVAIKLSPFYSAFANLARSLDEAGVDGIVVFNRFYQPDIDIENLEIQPSLHLSDSSELLLRLRWLAILSGRVNASLVISGGVHSATDAVKAVMAGADAIQMVSALLRHGPEHIAVVREGLERWLVEHEYESLAEARGSMSHKHCPDPAALERANYMRILQSWRRGGEW